MAALSNVSEDEKMVCVVYSRSGEEEGHVNEIRKILFMHFLSEKIRSTIEYNNIAIKHIFLVPVGTNVLQRFNENTSQS